ncbi:MAG: hypothetical protein HQ534_10450 [Armatimonadetes bacterium]|nr:hypothetical protein [Armatimonadota bacterium]
MISIPIIGILLVLLTWIVQLITLKIISLTVIGLGFIVLGWIVQLISLLGKSKTLNLFFVWLFLIGIIISVIGNIQFRSYTAAVLNIVLALLSLITLILYPKKKKVIQKEK